MEQVIYKFFPNFSIRLILVKRERPIIFICHCLGGILVKQAWHPAYYNRKISNLIFNQALDQAKQDGNFHPNQHMIYRCTYGIIFLGTPHRGSNATAWAEILEKMASFALHETNSMIIEELKANSPTLLNISRVFARILAARDIYSLICGGITHGRGWPSKQLPQ